MKDAKGHGSDKRGNSMPIPGHPYHTKSDAELRYIVTDASAAAKASQGMTAYNPNSSKREDTEGKYLDQVNDASSVLGYRSRGGSQVQPEPAAHASGVFHIESYNPKTGPSPSQMAANGRTMGYSPEAVNNAIASSNRSGRRIGGKEASAIHRLLRGRG